MLYQLNYWPICYLGTLTGLAMQRVMAAPLAVLLQLHTIGSRLFILIRRVITALALGARQRNQSTHRSIYSLYIVIAFDLACLSQA